MLILQCIPQVSSVSPAGTAFPLALVLIVTMIKDGYDDYQRKEFKIILPPNFFRTFCRKIEILVNFYQTKIEF